MPSGRRLVFLHHIMSQHQEPTARAFRRWLEATPAGDDNADFTLPLKLTLPRHRWEQLAQAAANNGETLEAVLSFVLGEAVDLDHWADNGFACHPDGSPVGGPKDARRRAVDMVKQLARKHGLDNPQN